VRRPLYTPTVNTRRPKLLLVADHAEVIDAARQLLDQRGAVVAATSVDKVLLHLDPSVDLIIALDVPPARMVPLLQLTRDTPGRGVAVNL
jgi:hypothetical protein